MFFGQTFDAPDLLVVGLLVVLEGVLSIDNALVLGVLARRLPKHQQRKALTYGLVGAFVFRLWAIAMAAWVLKWTIVKLLGGTYLIWIAAKHFWQTGGHDDASVKAQAVEETLATVGADEPQSETVLRGVTGAPAGAATAVAAQTQANTTLAPENAPLLASPDRPRARFWPTVFVIEMTDIAFAVDSILAAIGVVGSPPPGTPPDSAHPKLWVVIAGGFIGLILMRIAAILFIKLLERFPRFETAAYLLVLVIGFKLVVDWAGHVWQWDGVNFHSMTSAAFWVFWVTMLGCFAYGFWPQKRQRDLSTAAH